MNCFRLLAVFSLLVFALTVQASRGAAFGPKLLSVTLSPSNIVGGSAATGTVHLTGPAPADGLTVSLASNSATAVVPSFVFVNGGSNSATFSISTGVVSTDAPALISGALGSVTKSATLKILVASVSALTLSPNSVIGGAISTGTVTLNGPAAPGGAVVILTRGNAAASIPETVTVPGGANSVTFTVTTEAVAIDESVAIYARSGGASKSAMLTVQAPLLHSVSVDPSLIIGGNSVSGTITLHHPAPTGGVTVAISASTTDATMPYTLMIPAGAITNTFTITTFGVQSTVKININASVSGTIKSTSLTITPAQMTSLVITPNTVTGGTSATGTIYLSGAAATGGAVVELFSNNRVAGVPPTVTVATGLSQISFPVNTAVVNKLITAVLTAKFRGKVQTAGITVQPAAP